MCALGIINQSHCTASAIRIVVIGAVNCARLMHQQIARLRGDGHFSGAICIRIVANALRESKDGCAIVWTHRLTMRAWNVAHASVGFVHDIQRQPHCYCLVGFEHEVISILVWQRRLPPSGVALIEPLQILRLHWLAQQQLSDVLEFRAEQVFAGTMNPDPASASSA